MERSECNIYSSQPNSAIETRRRCQCQGTLISNTDALYQQSLLEDRADSETCYSDNSTSKGNSPQASQPLSPNEPSPAQLANTTSHRHHQTDARKHKTTNAVNVTRISNN